MGSLEVVGREDIERQQQERQGVSAHDGGRHGENFRRGRHENADHAEHRPEDVEERRRPQCQPERLADAVAPASAEVCGDDGLRRLPDAVGAALDKGADLNDGTIDRQRVRAEVFHDLPVEEHGQNAHGDVDEKRLKSR